MRIEVGATRFVILFDHFVVKLPRIRLFWMIAKSLKYGRQGEFKERVNLHAPSLGQCIIRHFTQGFVANLSESKFSRLNLPLRIMRTTFSLGGLICIQPRGDEVRESDPVWQNFCQLVAERGIDDIDFTVPRNFSLRGQYLLMHDYASSKSQAVLLSAF